jgi:hypothetical protein
VVVVVKVVKGPAMGLVKGLAMDPILLGTWSRQNACLCTL